MPKGTKEAYAAAEGWDFTNIDDGTTDDEKDDEDKDEDEDKDNPDDEEGDDEVTPDEDTDEENPDEEEEEVVSGPDISERNADGKIINYNYAGNMQELYVTKGDYWGVINIPDIVRGLPVTGIESDAFRGSTDLTAAGIPRSVTTIGDNAFNGCSSLESITIRSTVESIGSGAFGGCTALKKVVAEDIPAWCNISFGNIESNPLHHAGHLYSDDYTEITDLTIPNTVKRIGEAAFAGCIGLRSVSIGNNLKSEDYDDGVKEIGNSAFYGCSNLISVTLRGSVESIGAFAFCDCDILDSIAIPSGVKEIGDMAFYCSNITKVTSHIQEPFAIKASVFGGNTLMNGTLRVPDGTVDKYKATEGWREFAHIVGGTSTGIEDINAGKVTILANGGALNISGVKDGSRVVVYSMTGAMIGSGNVTGGTATIPTALRKGDIAIVCIGDTAVKVMIK